MKHQLCPVCNGSGVDRWAVASSAIPTRYSHPCHRCSGLGTILEEPEYKSTLNYGTKDAKP